MGSPKRSAAKTLNMAQLQSKERSVAQRAATGAATTQAGSEAWIWGWESCLPHNV